MHIDKPKNESGAPQACEQKFLGRATNTANDEEGENQKAAKWTLLEETAP